VYESQSVGDRAVDIFFVPFLNVLRVLLTLYKWVVLLGLILNWLIVFRVVNPYQTLVQGASHFYYQVTEPFLRRIRQAVPVVGSFDLSPLVLLLGVYFLEIMLVRVLQRF